MSKKLLGQFADNLRDKLESTGSTPEAGIGDAVGTSPVAPAPAEAESTTTAAAGSAAAAGGGPSTGNGAASTSSSSGGGVTGDSGGSAVRKIDSPEPKPVDLISMATGDSMAKKVAPAAGGLAIVALILYWLFGRNG